MKKFFIAPLAFALISISSICFSRLAAAGTMPESRGSTFMAAHVSPSHLLQVVSPKSVGDETVIYLGDPITATSSSVVVSGTTAIITGTGTYRAVGTLADGMIDVNTTAEVELILDGVAITHTAGPAINVTNAAKVSVVLADGTSNMLIDWATYSDTGQKATLFSNDTLEISGNGTLAVTGKYKHGIASDDDLIINGGNIAIVAAKKDGFHANDNITVNGGTINVTQASSDGFESEGNLLVAGGALTLTVTGDGIKSADTLTMTGGTINVISGTEGIESKNKILVNDGVIVTAVSDDGLNATNDITLNGGRIYLNTAGDAVDSNGALTVNGGVLVALGGDVSGSGLDCITCTLNGGIVVATGSSNSTPSSASAQHVVVFSSSTAAGSVIHVEQGGTDVLTFEAGKAFQSMIVSSPVLAANTTHFAYRGGSVSGGTDFYGLYTGATYSGGNVWSIFTTDAVVTYAGDAVAIYFPCVANEIEDTATPTPTPTATATATATPTATPTSCTRTSRGAYTQSGGSATLTCQAIVATATDESGVKVMNSGVLTLTDSTVTTSGNTSSNDNSSFYGLNAAVLAESASKIHLSNVAISTSGTGANGAFATGSGSSVILTNVAITATNGGGHGVMATLGGVLTMMDVDITTSGANSAPVATDRGGGTITAVGGTLVAKGQDSPCLYSTGSITVYDATCTATGAESAVIEGANSIALHNTTLSSSKSNKWGVMIYQSMSGDAQGARGVFTMTGGALANTASTGPLFYVTNSTGVITLTNVSVTAASGTLLKAAAGNWGTSGSNGGTANLTASGQTLAGNLTADSISSITATLKNSSTLAGAIDADNTAKIVNLTLDSTSTWTVTADSYLTCLSDTGGISGTTVTNITGNGHTVYYNQSACSALGGITYTLSGGGYLTPGS